MPSQVIRAEQLAVNPGTRVQATLDDGKTLEGTVAHVPHQWGGNGLWMVYVDYPLGTSGQIVQGLFRLDWVAPLPQQGLPLGQPALDAE